MWIVKISLLLYVVSTIGKTNADSLECERREKHDYLLELAKDSISKAKDLHPTCVDGDSETSSNSSKCGATEKVAAYLDVAMNLIKEAKGNYSDCGVTKNLTEVVLLHKNPIDCSEILGNGGSKSGVYTIWPKHRSFKGGPLEVFCDMDTDGGGWTMIQRRGNFSEKINFNRDWSDYKRGFGNINEEFWIGNDNIFALTKQRNYFVRFDMETVDQKRFFAEYDSFWIEDENAEYKLHFGTYNGTAGNGIAGSNEKKFSTKDRRNDDQKGTPCADLYMSGWWYWHCSYSNPNGINEPGGKDNMKYMNWYDLTQYDPLLAIEIKIRSED